MINHNKRQCLMQVSIKSLFLGIIFFLAISANRVSAQSVSVPSVFGVLGGVYGAADAILGGRDIVKGTWDGALFSARLPGFLLGGVAGLGTGTALHVVTFQPINERMVVGWMSAGATVGGAVAMSSVVDDVGRDWFNNATIPRVGRILYSVSASMAVPGIRQEIAKTSSADADFHRGISRQIRNRYDPGEALMMGFAKESMDYFFGAGTPEFRDLKNNWEGVFRGGATY